MTTVQIELDRLNKEFETADPGSVLRWASEVYGDELAVVTSFQPTGIVTLHMLSEIAPHTPVLTLDTGLLFPETYALMDDLEKRLNLNLIRVKPAQTVEQQAETHGSALWENDPDLCCEMRKVVPLGTALRGYQAWITGLRRDQPGRSSTPIISWDKKYQKIKFSPFATWTEDMIWLYIHSYELPYNKLHDQGYPSIGCMTCTKPATAGLDARSGRWANHLKSECGIHVA
jgi:phosphoadenosine phosphosulfate reductase